VSTLIANLPPKKVWVDKSYLTEGEEWVCWPLGKVTRSDYNDDA